MKDKIKRIAQMLFDNAEYFAEELAKTDSFRHLGCDFYNHKTGTKSVRFWITTGGDVCIKLDDSQIRMPRIRAVFKQIDEDSGVEPLPEPEKIREEL